MSQKSPPQLGLFPVARSTATFTTISQRRTWVSSLCTCKTRVKPDDHQRQANGELRLSRDWAGGSGGLASARRAAEYGARVALVEAAELGGTCVNVGCVPKKVMWNAAEIADALHSAAGYGFDVSVHGHDFAGLRQRREAYIERMRGNYQKNLAKDQVELIRGRGVIALRKPGASRRAPAQRQARVDCHR